MSDSVRFLRCSEYPLQAFAELYTRTFENYLYSISETPMGIANRVGVEQINLFHSVIMLIHDQPIGQALVGLRGVEAWCGGLGIIPEYRGKGLATGLLFELIKQTREAGAKQ